MSNLLQTINPPAPLERGPASAATPQLASERSKSPLIRLARISNILPINSTPVHPALSPFYSIFVLLSNLSVHMCHSIVNPSTLQTSLVCVYCAATISLSFIRYSTGPIIQFTAELLRKLRSLHSEECQGCHGYDLLQNNAQVSVPESRSDNASLRPQEDPDQMWQWLGSVEELEQLKFLTYTTTWEAIFEQLLKDRLINSYVADEFPIGLATHAPYSSTRPPRSAQLNYLVKQPSTRHLGQVALLDPAGRTREVAWNPEAPPSTSPGLSLAYVMRTTLNPSQSASSSAPLNAAPNYFFVQTPPDQSGLNPVQIALSDAPRRIREVHYDRGTIVNSMDIEAKEMADCRRRYDSFSKSEALNGKLVAYQLAQLGFYFVGDRTAVGKLRCSFCRRTIHMFNREDVAHLDRNVERLLISLLHRHGHLSATCPFSLGLNGDDKRFSDDDIERVIEPFLRTKTIQLSRVDLCFSVVADLNTDLRISASSILSQSSDGRPPFEGELATSYNAAFAEMEYEQFTRFESEPDFELDSSVVDDLIPQVTTIDNLIGLPPKHSDYITSQSRIDSFDASDWRQQLVSTYSYSNQNLQPESFARAGFYYSGTSDNVLCFWCGLGLNHWEATDDPVTEHVRFTPRCTWLLRTLGRQRVKNLYLRANGNQSGGATANNINPADYAWIRDVEDIAGGLEPEHASPVEYRTEPFEANARVDLAAHRAIIDEFGFPQELLLHALECQLKEFGTDHQSVQVILECLWAYDEWMKKAGIDIPAHFVVRAAELRRHVIDALGGQHLQAGASHESLCVVCMSAVRSVVLIPCGHFAFCRSCASLEQCPICRARIRGSIRTYIS